MTLDTTMHRWLDEGETVQVGDEYYGPISERWYGTGEPGRKAKPKQYRRRLDTPTQPTQTGPATGHNESKPMTLHRVWIVQTPSALEQQAGKTEELVLPTVEVLASTKQHAVALAVFQSHDKLAAVNLPRCTVMAQEVG